MRRFAKVAKIWGIVKRNLGRPKGYPEITRKAEQAATIHILFNIIYIIIHKEKRIAKSSGQV